MHLNRIGLDSLASLNGFSTYFRVSQILLSDQHQILFWRAEVLSQRHSGYPLNHAFFPPSAASYMDVKSSQQWKIGHL